MNPDPTIHGTNSAGSEPTPENLPRTPAPPHSDLHQTPPDPYNESTPQTPPDPYGDEPTFRIDQTPPDPYSDEPTFRIDRPPAPDEPTLPASAHTAEDTSSLPPGQQEPQAPPMQPTMPQGQVPPGPPQWGAGMSSGPQIPRFSARTLLLVLLAVLVIVAAAVGITVRNNQIATEHAQATATTVAHQGTVTAQVHATATSAAQATATIFASAYPFSDNLKVNDPLTDNSHGLGWDEIEACGFANGGYLISANSSKYYYTCLAEDTNFSDFTYQVSMQFKTADNLSSAGIAFRCNVAAGFTGYVFGISPQGDFFLFAYSQPNQKPKVLANSSTQHFLAHQKNMLAVVARGDRLSVYVNNRMVVAVTDDALSGGQIGMAAYYGQGPTNAVFTDAKVWQL